MKRLITYGSKQYHDLSQKFWLLDLQNGCRDDMNPETVARDYILQTFDLCH